jgi:hypothetical protein
VKLGRVKATGWRAANRCGFTAFFMRGDVGVDLFPESHLASRLGHPEGPLGAARGLSPHGGPWVDV